VFITITAGRLPLVVAKEYTTAVALKKNLDTVRIRESGNEEGEQLTA